MAELSLEQRRAIAVAQARLRMQAAPTARGPATRGRGGNLAEEQAAIDRVTGRNAPAAAAAPPPPRWAKGATYETLKMAAPEMAMSAISGGVGQGVAALRNVYGMLSGEDVAKETGPRGAATAESMTYRPRTALGQAGNDAIAYPFRKIQEGGNWAQDRLTDAGMPGMGVAANSAIQIAPQAVLTVLGMRSRQPQVPTAAPATPPGANLGPALPRGSSRPSGGWAPPVPRDPGSGVRGFVSRQTARFRAGGPDQIARDILLEEFGTPADRARISAMLRNAGESVPGFKPTAAQVLDGTPQGPAVAAYTDYVSRMSGSRRGNPVARFKERATAQGRAIEAAETARDLATNPMRRRALANANRTTQAITEAEAAIADRYASKAAALQDKGRFQSTAAEQSRRALNRDAPGGPITSRLGLDRPSRSTPPQATGAASRPPAKYTANAARADEAAAAAVEMDPIIAQRQAELAAAEGRLSNATAGGSEALTGAKVDAQVARVQGTPGLRASDVVQQSMSKLREKLAEITQKDGTVNADDLYTVRKELGNYIEQAAKESANWDKSLTGGLLRDMQKVMDDAIEGAGGTGWKEYLNEYSTRSSAIDHAKAQLQDWRKQAKDVSIGYSDHVERATSTGLPNMLERNAMIANAILRHVNKRFAPRVEAAMTRILLDDPAKVADMIDGVSAPSSPKSPMLPNNRLRAPARGAAVAGATQPRKKEKR